MLVPFIRRDSMGHGVLHYEAPTIPDFPGLFPFGVLFNESLRRGFGMGSELLISGR